MGVIAETADRVAVMSRSTIHRFRKIAVVGTDAKAPFYRGYVLTSDGAPEAI
jgi:hypothetical protein